MLASKILQSAVANNNIVPSYVQLLLRGEGTNGSTTILDSSANNFSMTNSGAVISTAQFAVGTSSIFYNGAGSAAGAGTYAVTPISPALYCASNADWTISFYIYVTSAPAVAYTIVGMGNSNSGNGYTSINFHLYMSSTRKLLFEYSQNSPTPADTGAIGTAISLNTWTLVGVTYTGSTKVLRTYLNPTLGSGNTADFTSGALTTFSTPLTSPRVTCGRTDPAVGAGAVYGLNGYIDNYTIAPNVILYTP